jgi:hypothetical protein
VGTDVDMNAGGLVSSRPARRDGAHHLVKQVDVIVAKDRRHDLTASAAMHG